MKTDVKLMDADELWMRTPENIMESICPWSLRHISNSTRQALQTVRFKMNSLPMLRLGLD